MTLLVKFPPDSLREYPVSEERALRAPFRELACRIGLAIAMEEVGISAPWNDGVVYGYILNRRGEFRHPHYGWGLPR